MLFLCYFKEKLRTTFIPAIKKMVEKEKEFLAFLKKSNAPLRFINSSQNYLDHYEKRLKQYEEYVNRKKG